jgi:polar amino acid transport system permease protein
MFQLTVNKIKRQTVNRSSVWQKSADLIKFLLVIIALVWFASRSSVQSDYNWQWGRVVQYLFVYEDGRLHSGPLIKGIELTLQICAVSMILAFLLGLLCAVMRLSDSKIARFGARSYLELIRNTPLLVQIFFIYFVLGPILDIDRFFAAVLALSLFEGAYISEIVRAGIVAIPQDQWEAAYSLGLNRYHTYRHIIIPQALRRILPPLVSQSVSLIKDSALVSMIAVYELTMQGQVIISKTFLTFEVWFTIAALYLMITLTLTTLAGMLEKYLRIE